MADGKRRVGMVVLDSVVTDSRVLKEADSFAATGDFDVMVFGIKDMKTDTDLILRDTGVRIILADWRVRTFQTIERIFMLAGVLALALVALLCVYIREIVTTVVGDVTPLVVLVAHRWDWALAGIAGLAVAGWFWKQAQKAKIVSMRLRNQRFEVGFFRRWWRLASNPKQMLYRLTSNTIITQEIISHLEAFKPEVVHCHDFSALPIGVAYTRKHKGVKLVYDSHEIYCERHQFAEWQRVKIRKHQKKLSRYPDAFITVNDSLAVFIGNRYPALPPAVVVKNASPYRDKPVEYDGRLHRKANIPAGDRIILFHGGIGKGRNLEMLSTVARNLPPDIHVVLMGMGNYMADLAKEADGLRNYHLVEAAPQDELPLWVAGAFVGVMPYSDTCLNHRYCSPNKLWEYPTAGVPFIASDLVEIRNVVQKYDCGWLVPTPMNPGDLIKVIATMTAEDYKAKKEGCWRFSQEDCWEVYAERLVELYRRLLP